MLLGKILFIWIHFLLLFVDRGNDNWLIKYEKTPEVDRQVEGEEGVSKISWTDN